MSESGWPGFEDWQDGKTLTAPNPVHPKILAILIQTKKICESAANFLPLIRRYDLI